MIAFPGDHIVVRCYYGGGIVRTAEVIESLRGQGRPPYLVRWLDGGPVESLYPGASAWVERDRPGYPPEYELDQSRRPDERAAAPDAAQHV